MKVKLIFSMALINYSVNAMDLQQNKPLPQLPSEVLYTNIFVPEKIVEQENSSVKNAREDLYALSLVNKQLHKTVTKKLNDSQFTEFFIHNLAEKKFLNGNKLAIAAHLGTIQSIQWIKQNFDLKSDKSSDKIKVTESTLQLDDVVDAHYMLNAHKLLFHLTTVAWHNYVTFTHIDDPQIKFNYLVGSQIYLLKKLQNDNKITHKILSLLLNENLIELTLNMNDQTSTMSSLIAERTDLLPLIYNEKTLNYQDNFGYTALMYATLHALDDIDNKNKCLEAFDFIVSKNPDVMLKNKISDKSALDLACSHQNSSTEQGQYITKKLLDMQNEQAKI